MYHFRILFYEVTGHNCFGAVLYPITVGDFIMADTSDSYLDGVISNFPSLYKQKVHFLYDSYFFFFCQFVIQF